MRKVEQGEKSSRKKGKGGKKETEGLGKVDKEINEMERKISKEKNTKSGRRDGRRSWRKKIGKREVEEKENGKGTNKRKKVINFPLHLSFSRLNSPFIYLYLLLPSHSINLTAHISASPFICLPPVSHLTGIISEK